MLSRPRIQPFAQLLLGVAAAVVFSGVALVAPSRIGPPAVAGIVLIGVACVVMCVVWLGTPTRGTEWIAIVPLTTIVACIPLREAGSGVLTGAGFLVLFPIGWLAFAFPVPFLVIGLGITAIIPIGDAVRSGGVPDGVSGWVATLTLPLLLTLYAATVAVISRDLRRQRSSALDAQTRMSDALRSSVTNEATMRALGDATPGALVVFDNAGVPLLVNPVAMGWARRANAVTSLLHGRLHIYGPDRTTPMPMTSFIQDLREGRFVASHLAWIGKPGEQMAVSFAGRPVVADGEVIATVLVGHDITDLLHAVDVRDRFLDTVGHELRSPLTVIVGNTELALAEELTARQRVRWQDVERASGRLLRTVERLMAAGRETLEPRSGDTDVEPIVRGALAGARGLAQQRGLDFAVIVEPGVRARVSERDLAEMVEELALNAVRFTRDGGSVVVDVRAERATLVVEVTDTGVGMTADERSQAFDRFFRGAHAYDAAVQGAGLGLSIVRGLAESNGGSIELEPNGAIGTVARLTLQAS